MAIGTAAAVTPLRDGDDISDHEFVTRIRAGDDRAFERLYGRYHRRIASYVQGMVQDHARAEDVTQDVFMSALRRIRDTDRPITFKPWIYEIAKNACIDQFRRSSRAEEVSYDADDALGSADYGRLVTKDPSPEAAVESKQQLDHLRGAFGGLSPTHHEILVMRELEGLSYREIGERLGMTRPAVESTLFRARRRLSEEFEDLVTGERCRRVQRIIAAAAAEGLGARDRKRLLRHVSHCHPCLRHARMAGFDDRDLVRVPLRQKIAAFLPLPALLRRKLGGSAEEGTSLGSAHDVSTLATWSAHGAALDPGLLSSWGKAAATAATIALAGVGAGVATQTGSSGGAIGAVPAVERLGESRGAAPVRAARETTAGAPTLAPGTATPARSRQARAADGGRARADAPGRATATRAPRTPDRPGQGARPGASRQDSRAVAGAGDGGAAATGLVDTAAGPGDPAQRGARPVERPGRDAGVVGEVLGRLGGGSGAAGAGSPAPTGGGGQASPAPPSLAPPAALPDGRTLGTPAPGEPPSGAVDAGALGGPVSGASGVADHAAGVNEALGDVLGGGR